MEINFYQVDDIIYKAIAPLLLKVAEDNKKTLIYCNSEKQLTEIDDGLWSFSKTKFLPHSTNLIKSDKLKPEEQPIFITNQTENFNQAKYLIIFEDVGEQFLNQFEKAFYFFGSGNITEARKMWSKYKNKSNSLNFYKKDDSGWMKVDL